MMDSPGKKKHQYLHHTVNGLLKVWTPHGDRVHSTMGELEGVFWVSSPLFLSVPQTRCSFSVSKAIVDIIERKMKIFIDSFF